MYGFHRVIKPKGVVPQSAEKVDNTPSILDSAEILLSVDFLNLDSTSMRQIQKDCAGNTMGWTPMHSIELIIHNRGKMHNPVTNSGGVLAGRIREIGRGAKNYSCIKAGDCVVPLVSLSAIPLRVESVDRIEGELAFCTEGIAVLFDHYPFATVPPDFTNQVALSALDISSIVPQIERLIKPRMKMLVVGCGKAGLTAMAVARRRYKSMYIVAADYSKSQISSAQKLGHADVYWEIDATNAELVYEFTRDIGFDLVVNCVNVPNTETSSIIAAHPGGTVIFFSMATAFNKAALGTDATGKDVVMIIGNGVAVGQAEKMFALLRADAKLLEYFESLHTTSKEAHHEVR